MSDTRDADVLCIGSGITALAFGAQMAHRHPGTRVIFLEKHTIPGGYATTFQRKRTRFDCSLHKLSGMGEGGNTRRIFADLGLLEELDLIYPETFFEAQHQGGQLALSADYPTFKRELYAGFPAEHAGLARFFEELETHGKNGYYQYQMLEGTYLPDMKQIRHAHKTLRKLSAFDALRERFQSPLLRELLGTSSVYVGGFPEDLSYLYFLHALYATLVCGSAFVRGGSQQLSNTLVARIRAAGGEVLLRTEVRRIVVEGERVVGVETNRGRFRADRIYVNAAPQYAVEKLLPPLPCLTPVRAMLDDLTPSWSTTSLFLVTDQPPEQLGLRDPETVLLPDDPVASAAARDALRRDRTQEALGEALLWSGATMEVTNYHRLDPSGGHAICINVLDDIGLWPERGTPAYRAKKARAEAALLQRLLAKKPELAGHIVYRDVSSPRTYLRYTNNHLGAGYGGLVGTDASGHAFHHRFPIAGVHFLSAWVAGSGYEAAFGYAEAQARRFAPAGSTSAGA